MVYFLAFLVIIGIYAAIKDALIELTGNEEAVNKVLEFFFNLVKILFYGYIVFWLAYSFFVTWG